MSLEAINSKNTLCYSIILPFYAHLLGFQKYPQNQIFCKDSLETTHDIGNLTTNRSQWSNLSAISIVPLLSYQGSKLEDSGKTI